MSKTVSRWITSGATVGLSHPPFAQLHCSQPQTDGQFNCREGRSDSSTVRPDGSGLPAHPLTRLPVHLVCALFTVVLLGLSSGLVALHAEDSMTRQMVERLVSGKEPVRIVCFGDSITGVYYHTGGRRAWCDMLGIALQRLYPQAKLEMFNAGISGNTSAAGLKRIERDVLAHKPHLVVVMFGMNDCAGGDVQAFRANLKTIVQRCREVGAAVVLCTPNSIYPQDARRVQHLAAFADGVREVASELSAPLADCYRAYEDLRAANPTEWKLLMSETIHPGMNGHKLFAEVIAETVSGKRIALGEVPPLSPSLNFTFSRLSQKQPVAMIAMPPYDRLMAEALRQLYPEGQTEVTAWPVAGAPLGAIEQWAKSVRAKKPALVVIAVPAEAQAPGEEEFIRSYNWVLDWSLSFGKQEWDVIAILPSVAKPHLTADELPRATLARRIILGKDIGFVERPAGDQSAPEAILSRWVKDQHAAFTTKDRPPK